VSPSFGGGIPARLDISRGELRSGQVIRVKEARFQDRRAT